MPPTTKRPKLRRRPAVVLTAATAAAVCLWFATGVLFLITPAGDSWKWTALSSAAALGIAAAATLFGQQKPDPQR